MKNKIKKNFFINNYSFKKKFIRSKIASDLDPLKFSLKGVKKGHFWPKKGVFFKSRKNLGFLQKIDFSGPPETPT